MPRCERVRRGVLTAAAGGYGCAQLAHYLLNFLLPQWDAMEQIGWLPAGSGGARPKTSDTSGSDKLMSRLAEHDKDMAASRPMT